MKEIKNLETTKSASGTIYRCSIDGMKLVEISDDGLHSISSCAHFQWYQCTKACYYLGFDIPEEELQELRKNSILTLHEGMFVYILLPAQS